ncbi:hypothetical protein [Companilactobacillus furfuricola]|uniref:hypothetical protein n=1 Tax=Companilactobacillus furfuricola TaxID=1462575 RepID=UPI000F79CDCD|nr:hypothetical protein [Companilactobacillus furfuricola]
MQTRMRRYHQEQNWSWGLTSLALIPSLVIILLMFILNAETLFKLTVALILILTVIGVIFLGVSIVDHITHKNNRKVDIGSITVLLSAILLFGSYRTICDTNYSAKGDLIVNIFQKQHLNKTAQKFQHIKKTLKHNDSYAQRQIALDELDGIVQDILKSEDSISNRSSIKTSANDLRDTIKGNSRGFTDINFMLLASMYGYSVLSEHYTQQQVKNDKARTISYFIKQAGSEI